MPEPFVRLYNPQRDFDSCIRIFKATIDKAIDHEPARTIGSYIWCRPYLLLSPETCFVLDDGSGEAVGYIIGTASTTHFASRWKSDFVPTVPRDVVSPVGAETAGNEDELGREWMRKAVYDADCSMLIGSNTLMEEYPAHLHIDILPQYTGREYGQKMMAAFLEKMEELGAKGVHLGMVRWNHGARRFYERLGFQLCGKVLDGGESGEVGRTGDAICLLKKL
ncbi:GCN5-related N-acetyltransferas-like protein [Lojkania enalia]|uniref:GCN5-related N-acetyltransferas-like protein n=1 Tax=Lojkania enalia TaxID=147567 RepID=A0A9P4N9H3_9PLEO|nr:GCN5-related N-acetyltransferas-like protein [Didymosphaeria enalia]